MATISVQTNKRRWRMDIRKTMPLMTMSGGKSTKNYSSYIRQTIVYIAVPGWGLRNGPSGMLVTPNSTNTNMTATMPLSQYQTNYTKR